MLNHGHYEDAKRLIQNQASRYGFFSGRFISQKLAVDPQAGVADIELIYDSGPRYSMGKVSFAGDTPFDDELLQRMVPFKSGDPYDSELIAELNQNLQASGFFEGVRVDASPTASTNDVIPVAVNLDTRKPRTMGLGLGYSTDVVRAARPIGPVTGSTLRATVMVGRPNCRPRARTSACGTTFRWTRRSPINCASPVATRMKNWPTPTP